MSLDERTVVERVNRVSLRELRLWVRQGWVRPVPGEAGPVFDDLDVARVRMLCDLRKDMSLPPDSMPVVLSLIDRLNQTRRELRCLAEALDQQPEHMRRTVIASFHKLREGADDTGET